MAWSHGREKGEEKNFSWSNGLTTQPVNKSWNNGSDTESSRKHGFRGIWNHLGLLIRAFLGLFGKSIKRSKVSALLIKREEHYQLKTMKGYCLGKLICIIQWTSSNYGFNGDIWRKFKTWLEKFSAVKISYYGRKVKRKRTNQWRWWQIKLIQV